LNKKEFNDKVKKYYSLNEQIKKMTKVKNKLNDELKQIMKQIMKQKKVFKWESMGLRMVLDEKERTNPDNNKIKKFLLDSDKKISDFYKKGTFFTLTVTKIETTIKMESI